MLSVVIPTYNMREYIHDAVYSILRQPLANCAEIICVDDGSEDGTVEYCKQAFNDLEQIRVIALEHKGVSSARNEGIAVASGRYVAFLDADDIWTEGVLNNDTLTLLDDNPDLVGFGWATTSADVMRNEIYSSKMLKLQGGYQAVLEGERSFACYFYRREFLCSRSIRFPMGIQVNEDEVFRTLCLYYSETVLLSNQILFHNRLRINSLRSIRYSTDVRLQMIQAWVDLFHVFEEKASDDIQIRQYCQDKLRVLLEKIHRERKLDDNVLDLCSSIVDVSHFRRILHAPKVSWLESMHRRECGLLVVSTGGGLQLEKQNKLNKAFRLVKCENTSQIENSTDCTAIMWFADSPLNLEEGLCILRLHVEKKLILIHLDQSLDVTNTYKVPTNWQQLVEAAHCLGIYIGFVWRKKDEVKYRIWADSDEEIYLVWDIYSASFPGQIYIEKCLLGAQDD